MLYINASTAAGANLYAYCMNNPVMYTDSTGESVTLSLILIGLGIGVAFGAGSSIVSQGIEYGLDNINWGQVAFDGVMGGIMGGLAMTGAGVGLLIGAGAITSFASYIYDVSAHGKEQTWSGVLLSVGLGAFFGGMGGNGAMFGKYGVQTIGKIAMQRAVVAGVQSAAVSGGTRIIMAGVNKGMNTLTNGDWSDFTGLNPIMMIKKNNLRWFYL